MEQTLLLNATYEPLRVVHWQKAITLWCQGKVEIVAEYDREIRSVVTFSIRLPSVIRLLRRIRVRRTVEYVPFSRANIYARDNHACQYCGLGFSNRRADLRSRRAGGTGRPQGLGEHRHLLHPVQSPEGRADAGAGRDASDPSSAAAGPRASDPHHVRPAESAGELARLRLLERRRCDDDVRAPLGVRLHIRSSRTRQCRADAYFCRDAICRSPPMDHRTCWSANTTRTSSRLRTPRFASSCPRRPRAAR